MQLASVFARLAREVQLAYVERMSDGAVPALLALRREIRERATDAEVVAALERERPSSQ